MSTVALSLPEYLKSAMSCSSESTTKSVKANLQPGQMDVDLGEETGFMFRDVSNAVSGNIPMT